MAGVAQQRDAALAPLRHRPAHHHRPFVGCLDAGDHLVHVGVPAAEVVGELVLGALRHPGFDLPVVALDEADEVHDLAAPHRIVQHVAVRAEPVDALHLPQMRRQLVHRHQAAPRDAAGEIGLVGAEQRRRAPWNGCRRRRSRKRRARLRRPRSAPRRGRLRRGWRRSAGRASPRPASCAARRPPAGRAGRPGAASHAACRSAAAVTAPRSNQFQVSPVDPVPDHAPRRQHLHALERVLEAQRIKHARAVRADLDAGADLLELRRLLVDLDVEPALEQRQRRGKPADAATDNDDLVLCRPVTRPSRRLPSRSRSSAAFPRR